jgi:hypothetical protein
MYDVSSWRSAGQYQELDLESTEIREGLVCLGPNEDQDERFSK